MDYNIICMTSIVSIQGMISMISMIQGVYV